MIAALLEIGMVVLLHLVCVNAIIYTSDCEGRSQLRALEKKQLHNLTLAFYLFSLSVLVVLGFDTLTGSCNSKHGFN